MKKCLLSFIVFFIISLVYSPATEWKIFHKPIKINQIISINTNIWGITLEGLVFIDGTTGKRTYYHAHNSDLPVGKYLNKDSKRLSIIDHSGIIWISHSRSSDFAVSGFNPMNGISINLTKEKLRSSCWQQSETYIASIAVDKDNYKWFGTTKGKLLEYDGDQLSCDDPFPLDSFPLEYMTFDSENNLWLGYDKFYKYYKGHITEYPLDQDIAQQKFIKSIATDSKGNLWYSFETDGGSKAFGLHKFNGTDHEKWNIENTGDLSSNYVRYIFCDSEDRIWFVSDAVIRFDGIEFVRYDLGNSGIDKNELMNAQCSFAEDDIGTIWFSCGYDVLFFDGSKFSKIPSEELMFPTENEIQDLLVDNNSKAYMTQIIEEEIESNELLILSGENFRKEAANTHLDFMDIDSKGNIWIGSGDTLTVFDGASFSYTNTSLIEGRYDQDQADREGITSLKVDFQDNIWFTGNYSYEDDFSGDKYSKGNGLLMYNGYSIDLFLNEGKGGPFIPEFYFAPDGSVWTKPYIEDNESIEYLNLYRIKDNNEYEVDIGKPNDLFELCTIDVENNLWLSSNIYGLMKRRNDNHLFIYDSKIYDIPSKDFSMIKTDAQNKIWLICKLDDSTGAHIITIFDNDVTTNLDGSSDTLFTKKIKSLDFDSDGNCWIVADEKINGVPLYRITPDEILKVKAIDPQTSDIPGYEINHLEIDDEDNLWIDCNLGFAIYSEENIIIDVDEQAQKLKMAIHPNPFSQSTTINYELREAGHIYLVLFDMLGNRIETLVDDWQEKGKHQAVFNVGNTHAVFNVGNTHACSLPAGMYFLKLQAGGEVFTKKIVHIK